MGYRARTSNVCVDGHTFKVGDTIYDTTSIGNNAWGCAKFDFYTVGLRLHIVDIVVDEDGAWLDCVTSSGSPDTCSANSSNIWCKESSALEFANLAKWIYSNGEDFRKENWNEYCNKIKELRRADRR